MLEVITVLYRQDMFIKKNYNTKQKEAPFPCDENPDPMELQPPAKVILPQLPSVIHKAPRSDNSTDSVKTLFGIFTLFLRPKLFLNKMEGQKPELRLFTEISCRGRGGKSCESKWRDYQHRKMCQSLIRKTGHSRQIWAEPLAARERVCLLY